MAVYTTSENVIDEIADDINAAVTAKIPGWAEAESRTIDATLINYTTPFNDIAGTPPTPAIVEKACRLLVVDRVMRKLGLIRTDENGRLVETYRQAGERIIRQLRDGDLVIPSEQL